MKGRSVKRIVVTMALAVATAISGMAGPAQAFSFNDGDLVLAIFGNNTESLINLGSASSQLVGPSPLSSNVSSALAAASVGNSSAVRYTVFGVGASNVWAGTNAAPGSIDPTSPIFNFQYDNTNNMKTLGGFAGDSIAKADPKSFSSNLDPGADGSMNGSWPVVMNGKIGDVLNILNGDLNTGAFTQVGRILLSADGSLLIGNPGPGGSPVPLPAGVVLFGTGVIGLIGVARRSFNRMAA